MKWNSLLRYARSNKLFIFASLSILIILSGLFHLNYLNARGILYEKFDQQISHHHELINQQILTKTSTQRELLEYLHDNPVIIKIVNDAYNTLQHFNGRTLTFTQTKKVLAPYHKRIKYLIAKNWPNSQIQLKNFHLQVGNKQTSLLRLESPNLYGDQVHLFSPMSATTFNKGVSQQGFELTDKGIVSQTILPITHNKTTIGTIELGVSLRQIIAQVHKHYNSPIQLNVTTDKIKAKSNIDSMHFKKVFTVPLYGKTSNTLNFEYTLPIKAQTQKLWDFYLFRAIHLTIIFILANFALAYLIKFYNKKLEEIIEFRTQKLREEISHHRETSRKLKQKSKEAYLNSKYSEIGELASGIAHEINNPLMIIQASLFKLKRITDSNILTDPLIEACNRNVNRMSKIINSLKVYSRDGRNDQMQNVQIKSVLDAALDLVQINLRQHQVEFTSEITEQFYIHAQEVQLIQIFVNLIKNSCDAVANLDKKWIRISAQEDENNIFITLTDSGKGIPKNLQSKIFMSFFTTKDVGKGTGLGLSLVKEIVQQHKGTIEIKPDEPNTTFFLTFPRCELSEENSKAA